MAATETSSAPPVLPPPLTKSQIIEKLYLKARPTPKPSAAVSHPPKKRKCSLCSPTAHHGRSFLCPVHRRLAKENIEILLLKAKRRRSGFNVGILGLKRKRRRCCFTTSDSGLNLRKTAMVNSLAGIGSVEAGKCRKYLRESMVKPSSLRFRRVFRPRRSRFYALHDDKE